MPNVVFPLDATKAFTDQELIGHNRWHPDIPAQVHVKPGDTFRVDCREWFDGAIHNDDSADDVRDAPLSTVHVLSGPVAVEGAEPGDLLVVDILDLGPIPQEDSGPLAGQGWGYTGVFATQNGGGFLTEQFPDAYKVIWDFQGQTATNFTKWTRVFYPVYVSGVNLSMGDLHFSQGDGEITICGAIEMGGFIDLYVDLIKGGTDTYGVGENAIFMPGNVDPQYSQWLAFSGTSVTLDDEQRYLDSHLSYQRACLHAIDYLTKFGYSPIQAYMILGAAPIEGRLSGAVDIPSSCSTVYLPTAIFDVDVRPSGAAPTTIDPGMGVPHSSF